MEEIIKLINEEKYLEALSLISNEDEESLYYKALILFKLSKLEASLLNIEKGLGKASKFYYDFIKLKVEIYLRQEKLKEALKILEIELSMPYIPKEFNAYFNETYQNILKELKANEKTYSPYDMLDEDELKEELLKMNKKNLIFLIHQLSKRNVRSYLKEIKILLTKDIPNMYKSVLLETMLLQGINDEVIVKKNELELTVIPSSLTPFAERESFKKIYDLLNKLNVTNDVSIEQNYAGLLYQYIGDIYPLDVDEEEIKYVAVAIHIYANELFGFEINKIKLSKEYELNLKVLDVFYNQIKDINDTFVSY